MLSGGWSYVGAGHCPASGVGRVAPRSVLAPRHWREVREALSDSSCLDLENGVWIPRKNLFLREA